MERYQAIDLISQLPFIPEWYVPETSAAKEQIDKLKYRYRCIARWLRNLMLDGQEPDYSTEPELLGYFFPALHLQKLHELITAIKLALRWENINPTYFWLQCAVSDCEWILKQKGITSLIETGVPIPCITGKTDLLQHQTEALQKYDAYNTSPAQQVTFSTLSREVANEWLWLHLRNWVEGEAFKLAKENRSFREIYWQPYLATLKEHNNIVRESEEFQLSYLMPDGNQLVTAKYAKLPTGFDSDIRFHLKAKRKEKKIQMLQNRYKNG